MARKENNRKDYSAREKWMKCKKEGRPKQVWDAVIGWIKGYQDAATKPEPDTSDIPEVKDWSKAVRGKFYRPKTVETSA